jgi:hypothetical protein
MLFELLLTQLFANRNGPNSSKWFTELSIAALRNYSKLINRLLKTFQPRFGQDGCGSAEISATLSLASLQLRRLCCLWNVASQNPRLRTSE